MLKNIFKVSIRIVLALLLIIVLFLSACLRRIDYRPYQESKYYEATIRQLDNIVKDYPDSKPDTLFMGAAKAGITPPIGLPLAGFGNRKGKPSTGVHDSLFVRVIALKSGAQQAFIVGYNALLLHPPVARMFEKKAKQMLDVEPESFFYTATHSHSGPGGWGSGFVEEQFSGPFDSTIVHILIDSTLAAVSRAKLELQPSTFTVQTVHAPEFIRNRLVGDEGQVDDDLIFAAFTSDTGQNAVCATYSAHATVLPGSNMHFSGDYPGYMERKVESEWDATCLFAAAGLGSHSNKGKGEKFDKAAYIGEGLADSLLNNLPLKFNSKQTVLKVLRIPVTKPRLQIKINNDICLAPWFAKQLFKPYDAYLQFIVLNDFIMIGSPGEFSGELALEVKHYAAQYGKIATVTSFNGCYMGYVTPSKYYHLDKYETKLMSWYGPWSGDYLADLMKQMIDRL